MEPTFNLSDCSKTLLILWFGFLAATNCCCDCGNILEKKLFEHVVVCNGAVCGGPNIYLSSATSEFWNSYIVTNFGVWKIFFAHPSSMVLPIYLQPHAAPSKLQQTRPTPSSSCLVNRLHGRASQAWISSEMA